MNNIIELASRHSRNYLKLLRDVSGKDSETYILKTEYGYLRTGYTAEGDYFVDPSDGPIIITNCPIPMKGGGLTKRVKRIDSVIGAGIVITFFEDEISSITE